MIDPLIKQLAIQRIHEMLLADGDEASWVQSIKLLTDLMKQELNEIKYNNKLLADKQDNTLHVSVNRN